LFYKLLHDRWRLDAEVAECADHLSSRNRGGCQQQATAVGSVSFRTWWRWVEIVELLRELEGVTRKMRRLSQWQ